MAIPLNALFAQQTQPQQAPAIANILAGLGTSMTTPTPQQASALPALQLLANAAGGGSMTQMPGVQQYQAPQYSAQGLQAAQNASTNPLSAGLSALSALFDTTGYDTPAVSKTPEPLKQDAKAPAPTVAQQAAKQAKQAIAGTPAPAPQRVEQAPAASGQGPSPIASILSSVFGQPAPTSGDSQESNTQPDFFARPEVIAALAQFGSAAGQQRSAGESLAAAASAFMGTQQAQTKAASDAEDKRYKRALDAEDRAIKRLDAETRAKVANSTVALNEIKAKTEEAGLSLQPQQARLLEAKIKTEAARAAKLSRPDSEGGVSSLIKPKDYASLMVQVGRDLYVEDPLEKRAIVNAALPEGARQYESLTDDAIMDLQTTLTDPAVSKADKQKAVNRAILIYGPDATITK